MIRLRSIAGPVAAALLLAACAARAVPGAPVPAAPAGTGRTTTTTTTAGATTSATAAGNRALAQQAVDRLVREAALPPGTIALPDPPARLTELSDGYRPNTTALVTRRAYWRVPLPQAQATRWFREHPGPGLHVWTDGTSGILHGEHLDVLAFRAPDDPAFDDPTLDVQVAAGSAGESLVRIGGSAFWLDPTPLRDDASGPRLHLTIVGGCPASPGDAIGVRNDGPPVTDAIVPAGTVMGGLVCDYGHGDFHRWKPVQVQRLNAAAATREAGQLRDLSLAHPPAGALQPRSCPPGLIAPAPTRVVVLRVQGRPDVDVWQVTPCGTRWTANGWVGTPA